MFKICESLEAPDQIVTCHIRWFKIPKKRLSRIGTCNSDYFLPKPEQFASLTFETDDQVTLFVYIRTLFWGEGLRACPVGVMSVSITTGVRPKPNEVLVAWLLRP